MGKVWSSIILGIRIRSEGLAQMMKKRNEYTD